MMEILQYSGGNLIKGTIHIETGYGFVANCFYNKNSEYVINNEALRELFSFARKRWHIRHVYNKNLIMYIKVIENGKYKLR